MSNMVKIHQLTLKISCPHGYIDARMDARMDAHMDTPYAQCLQPPQFSGWRHKYIKGYQFGGLYFRVIPMHVNGSQHLQSAQSGLSLKGASSLVYFSSLDKDKEMGLCIPIRRMYPSIHPTSFQIHLLIYLQDYFFVISCNQVIQRH